MTSPKILLTGATGYIGGSVLTQLLSSKHESLSNLDISVLVRGEDRAKVLESKGVKPILFNNLDESDLLQKVASEHDVVIHTALGFHISAAKSLILGLGQRKKATGQEVHYIHTSGTSNLADQPITGKYHEDRIFSDKDNIYAYEKSREALQEYKQRTTDITVVETGLAEGVQTHIIMSPTIYGIGSGLFNKLTIQAPSLIRASIKKGHVERIGDGKGLWNYVHIEDLADFYEIILLQALAGEQLPSGEQGIIFSATGTFSWSEFANGVASALKTLGAIKTDEVKPVSVLEATAWFGGMEIGNLELAIELGFASNSRTSSDIGPELGWRPKKTETDFQNHFLEEAKLVLAETAGK